MAWNAAPTKKLVLGVIDFTGKIATTEYWVDATEDDPASGGCAELTEAVQGISAGWVQTVSLQATAVNDTPGSPATGPYDNVQTKLDLEFQCADGSTVTLQLPGPLASTLGSDNYHVNPAASNITALVNAMKTNGRSASGSEIIGLANGYRRTPPRLKKH